jgi:NAD-dependent deacetylase
MGDFSENTRMGIRCAADILRSARQAVVLTGAGVSTPSGIPDFRSTNSGLWEKFDPFEVASLAAFRYHQDKFFNWMRSLAVDIRAASPNPAHQALARLEQAGFVKAIVTQNIDSLHQRAGSQQVYEVHGSLRTLTCGSCYQTEDAEEHFKAFFHQGVIPRCSRCGYTLKPDIVLFGEQLPARTWLLAQQACSQADVLVVAGSSLEVLPVAGLPMRALDNGAHLIVINKSQTYIDVRADVVLHIDVAEILPPIVDEVLGV